MVSCWDCAQERVGGQKCVNRKHQLEKMIPELRQHLVDCKVECEEAQECGDLEDRIESVYRVDDAEAALLSAEIELNRLVALDELAKQAQELDMGYTPNAALTGAPETKEK